MIFELSTASVIEWLMAMLQPDPNDRLSMDEALNHPWLNDSPHPPSRHLRPDLQVSFTAIRGDPAQSSDFGSSFNVSTSGTAMTPTTPAMSTGKTLDEQCSQDLENLRIEPARATDSEPTTPGRVQEYSSLGSLNLGSIVSEFPSVPSMDDIGMPYPTNSRPAAAWNTSVSNESPIQIMELGSAWQPTPPLPRPELAVAAQDTIRPSGRNKRKDHPDVGLSDMATTPTRTRPSGAAEPSPTSSSSSLTSLSDLEEELEDGAAENIDVDELSVAGSSKPTSSSSVGRRGLRPPSTASSTSRARSTSGSKASRSTVVKKGPKRQRMSITSPPSVPIHATRSSTRSSAANSPPSPYDDEPKTPTARRNNFKANVKGKLAARR